MDLLLIDNSNIFIEIKNLVGSEGRFDYDKFVREYANSINQKKILVGSTPPKSDTFWITMKNKGFEVYTYERNGSNREKAVDSKIVAEGVSHIVQQEHSGILNFLSGDRDMIPLIEKAIEHNWKVYLWSWRDSLSKEYLDFQNIEIKYLDDISENLIYFNYENDGYVKKEYIKEREARLKMEAKNREFSEEKRRKKISIWGFKYLSDQDAYISEIDKLTDSSQIEELNNIFSSAREENNRLKIESEAKDAEKKNQQALQENINKDAIKPKNGNFWGRNIGWLAFAGTGVLGGIAAFVAQKKSGKNK